MRKIAFCLIAVLLLFVSDAGAQSSCPPAPRSPIRDEIEQEDGMPSRSLLWTYERYIGRQPYWPKPSPQEVESLRVKLRQFVLDKTPDYVARNRTRIAADRWRKAFIADFDTAIRDMESVRAGDPESMRKVGVAWHAKGDLASRHLGQSILSEAAKRCSLAALHDLAQIAYAEGRQTADMASGTLFLWSAADAGHGPAQSEMMDRHVTGDGVERSPEKSYYWGLRAQRNGMTVDQRLDEIGRLLTADQRRRVEHWISTNAWVRP